MECHSAWSRGVSDFKTGLGRGGRVFPPREGSPEGTPGSIVPNITSHPTAGIGGWTDAEIVRAVTHGIGARRPATEAADGLWLLCRRSRPADLADIVAYLRTVPPLP